MTKSASCPGRTSMAPRIRFDRRARRHRDGRSCDHVGVTISKWILFSRLTRISAKSTELHRNFRILRREVSARKRRAQDSEAFVGRQEAPLSGRQIAQAHATDA